MLKFLSKVRIEFNALDPRVGCCLEFLAQCKAPKAKDSNPGCQLEVKRHTNDHPPQITVTYNTGHEEVIDASSADANNIRKSILTRSQLLEHEQMFRENGEAWPVVIPEEEIDMPFRGTKPRIATEKRL